MKSFKTTLLVAALLAATPFAAQAESTFTTGAGALSANARLDFQVTIPKILFLQVGTGTFLANNAANTMISFAVPAANVGDSTAVAGTGGNSGASGVTARLLGNGGNITLASTTAGAMTNVAADTLSFAQISSSSSNVALPAPALVDGSTTSTTITATNRVVNESATWTYSYLNTVTPAAGTYGGADVNNGRVTYTASMP